MTDTRRPKIALASVHGVAEHLQSMSTLKSRCKISNKALNSVHPSPVNYNTNRRRQTHPQPVQPETSVPIPESRNTSKQI